MESESRLMEQQFLVPLTLLNDLVQVASQAPVPYAKTQPMWAAVTRLQPHQPEPVKPVEAGE